ncbi:transcriptional regulator [Kaistia sp. 32K]|uniref:FadR/GntR family transcriptional regulator n=1 Tax=Kaistia sp. 32K TaxID=2795690 RepID=UPI001915536E|nr:FadR/GntR family transcriptional regulator [Kaistia sp. 32K]BCP55479.1 transcriptional regulator [Kaistia sp. 32K]
MKRLPPSRLAHPEKAAEARLPQLEPVRLYRQIADLIRDRIDQGLFPIGTLLPAERELAQQLGVSRTSVREALIALEVSGKVSIRVGHGVQILEATPRPDPAGAVAGLADRDIGPIELMEARLHIELRTAELAAANRTEADLERMREAIELQDEAESVRAPNYRNGDRNFHVAIARASGNAAYAFVIASLWDNLSRPLFNKFEELLVGPDRPAKTVEEHRRILDAIADGREADARAAMQKHLDAVLLAFSRGLGDE